MASCAAKCHVQNENVGYKVHECCVSRFLGAVFALALSGAMLPRSFERKRPPVTPPDRQLMDIHIEELRLDNLLNGKKKQNIGENIIISSCQLPKLEYLDVAQEDVFVF